ncbi:MAG TPA: hypothetical protein VJ938_14655 [Acidimicrobiia bacterium]|nr:hypothetical protein [Acidimicrobiia bacterium]
MRQVPHAGPGAVHLAPVVIVPHHVGPDGWTAALGVVADALDARPDTPLALRIPGTALDHLVSQSPRIWERLRPRQVGWLAGGWSDPVLADLPPAAARLQLSREKAVMDAAGIVPMGLWIGNGWERSTVDLAVDAGFRLVFIDAALVGETPDRPGAVSRADTTILLVAVADAFPPVGGDDGMVAVRFRPSELARLGDEHPGQLIRPDAYLSDHLPGDRLSPAVSVPGRSEDAEVFYRKLLGVIRDQPDRGSAPDLVLALQSSEFTTGAGGGPEAHHRLLEARIAVDRARFRGDTWVSVEEVDWDGDGVDEIHVETAFSTLVVDPVEGQILVWDDKAGRWPITSVAPIVTALIARRIGDDGAEPTPAPLRLERRTEGRAETRLTMVDADGGHYRLILGDRSLTVRLNPAASEPVLLGPEVPLLMDPSLTRVRVDGGEWQATGEPVAASGHRFRFTDGEREILLSSPRPCDVFVRPHASSGLMVWPHWPTTGDGEYQVTFEPL